VQIIPAVDIRGGRCVRLKQGDYARETVFDDDPAAAARRWQEAGAARLHVVDLDGAREGRPVNNDAVRAILQAVSIPVQLGGGIRTIETIDSHLKAGIDRVVLGTAAVKDQTVLVNAVALFRDRVAAGVDAREGVVRTEGWLEAAETPLPQLVRRLGEIGVARIIYTDISSDGMLSGPNFQGIHALMEEAGGLPSPVSVIASGGVSSVEHIRRLKALGVEGAIIGTALYTGALDLGEALAAAGSQA
jgi:phosphoribosylformimino-5-aminoimidazole carboxamide ribotide isomerase